MLPLKAKSSGTSNILKDKKLRLDFARIPWIGVGMPGENKPTEAVDPILGRLFGLATSMLETAHETSLADHRLEKGLEHLKSSHYALYVQLQDIATIAEAIDAIINKTDH